MTSHTTIQRIYVDRSRILAYQKCPRLRFLEYHQSGTGVVPAKKSIALAVGGAVHKGLEVLLREGQAKAGASAWEAVLDDECIEELAVDAALADFSEYSGALEVDTNELAAMAPTMDAAQLKADMIAQAEELGMSAEGLGIDREQSVRQFDGMLYEEQSALVEALVRAYARHKLRLLLEQFEVLEVEREGEWKLTEWPHAHNVRSVHNIPYGIDLSEHGAEWDVDNIELWFMSRPDALLRERSSNQLYILSFKTTSQWDMRKERDAQHDMQGLSEGVEVEQRLGEWWQLLQAKIMPQEGLPPRDALTPAMFKFLHDLPEPPRIYAVRYEYLLKGERWEDKELSAKLGMTVRTQRSHLIRQYVAKSVPQKGTQGFSAGDVCWSWDYLRVEDDKDSKLAWQNWSSQPVWKQDGGVKAWINKLAASEVLMSGEDSTIGMEPRVLGWKSEAQRLGVTRVHPFDEVFPAPIIVFRNDDELRDVFEQIEAQEQRVAEDVQAVSAAVDLGERRSLLNRKFPQTRSSCFYPTECRATKICYAQSADVQADPLGVGEGKFVRRVPNHKQELRQGKT